MTGGCRIRCTKCGDIIQSVYRHDYVTCSCGKTFVDGGNSYLRCGGDVEMGEDGSVTIYDGE
jgi:hypothetical protein